MYFKISDINAPSLYIKIYYSKSHVGGLKKSWDSNGTGRRLEIPTPCMIKLIIFFWYKTRA